MIRFLSIRHLAVIDALDVEFGPGLNVLTGETGAGKSIVVEAVGFKFPFEPEPPVIPEAWFVPRAPMTFTCGTFGRSGASSRTRPAAPSPPFPPGLPPTE